MMTGLLTRLRRKKTDPYAELGGAFVIRVTKHAQERAEERFGVDLFTVIQDVAAAGAAGRMGRRVDHYARYRRSKAKGGAVFAWTEHAERVYVVRPHGRGWSVVTVVESEAKPLSPIAEKLRHLLDSEAAV